jgi:hypothetical protein
VLLRTRTHTQRRRRNLKAAIALAAALALVPASAASAGSGGTSTSGSGDCGADARLVDGKAQAPDCAPRRVKRVIRAANEIAKGKDYCYGGGHSDWKSSCYDCSGSVSYALHGGDFIDHPMDSSGFMHWAHRGKGNWITVYANSGHAFAVIAGLRFDTSDTRGAGPGWAKGMGAENPRDYRKRHKGRY